MNETPPNPKELSAPLLFRSSENTDWQDLVLQAYHEPDAIETWIDPLSDDIGLVLMLRGSMFMEQERGAAMGKTWQVQEGDCFLKPAGMLGQAIRWQNLSPIAMQTLHIHLSKDLFFRIAAELSEKNSNQLEIVGRTAFQDPLIKQIGLALWQELENPSALSKIYAESAAQILAVHLLRHYSSKPLIAKDYQTGLNPKQLSQVKEFIEANLATNLSLENLAHLLDFSPYHFARLFRQTTGQSPYQFILKERIARAKFLIRKTKMPLAQIALETGFAHQSHLNQVFKRQIGLSPKAYRQSLFAD